MRRLGRGHPRRRAAATARCSPATRSARCFWSAGPTTSPSAIEQWTLRDVAGLVAEHFEVVRRWRRVADVVADRRRLDLGRSRAGSTSAPASRRTGCSSSSSASSAPRGTSSTWSSSRCSPRAAGVHHIAAAIGAFCVAVTNNFCGTGTGPSGDLGHAGFQAARFFTVSLAALGVNLRRPRAARLRCRSSPRSPRRRSRSRSRCRSTSSATSCGPSAEPAAAAAVVAVLAPRRPAAAAAQSAPGRPGARRRRARRAAAPRAPREAIEIAERDANVREAEAERGRSRPVAQAKPPDTWQVGFKDGDDEVVQVLVDDPSGTVRESWTGHQVEWQMARGYEGSFGGVLNAPVGLAAALRDLPPRAARLPPPAADRPPRPARPARASALSHVLLQPRRDRGLGPARLSGPRLPARANALDRLPRPRRGASAVRPRRSGSARRRSSCSPSAWSSTSPTPGSSTSATRG